MDHDAVHIYDRDIARLYGLFRYYVSTIFSITVSFPLYSPLIETIQLAHGFYKTACADNVHQVLRKRCDRVSFAVVVDVFVHHNGYGIALFDVIVKCWLFD